MWTCFVEITDCSEVAEMRCKALQSLYKGWIGEAPGGFSTGLSTNSWKFTRSSRLSISHRSFGFRTAENFIAAIYHCCAELPLPLERFIPSTVPLETRCLVHDRTPSRCPRIRTNLLKCLGGGNGVDGGDGHSEIR